MKQGQQLRVLVVGSGSHWDASSQRVNVDAQEHDALFHSMLNQIYGVPA